MDKESIKAPRTTYFVGGRVSWFVEINESVVDIVFDGSLEWRATRLQRCVVTCTNYHTMIILKRGKEEKK